MSTDNYVRRSAIRALVLSAVMAVIVSLTSGCASGTPWLQQIVISPGNSSTALGEGVHFTAVADYSDGRVKDVTSSAVWSSANPQVAALAAAGSFTPKSVGTTVVTATLSGINGAAMLAVTPAALTGITLNAPSSMLFVGRSLQLSATGTYSDDSTADISNQVNWTVAQPDILSVNGSGMALAEAAGSTQVTASLNGLNASESITVSAATLSQITVVSKALVMPLGTTQQLTAMGAYTDGTTADLTARATWTSSSPGTIAVLGAGTVQAAGTGNASVTAAFGGISGGLQFTVAAAALTSITVTAAQASLPLGNTEQLRALGTYTDSSTQDVTASAQWTSSTPATLSVTGPGSVTARTQGNATVTASLSGISGVTQITVAPSALVSIAISASHSSLPLGTSAELSLAGTYTDGSTADLSTEATWTSSSPGILAVHSAGTVEALAVGSDTVTASFGGLTATANLTVVPAALTSIAVTAPQSSLPQGTTQQLKAIGTYTDSSTQDITTTVVWTSSSPATLSVTGPGDVQARAPGTATVTASSSGITGGIGMTVTQAALVSIALSAAHSSLALGTSLQISAIGTYTDNTTQDLTASASWISSSPAVVSAAADGYLVAHAVGTCVISASVSNVVGNLTVTVTNASLAAIAVFPGNSTLPTGQTAQLTATASFSDGTTQDITQSAVWTTSSSAIVSIPAPGTIAAVSTGSAAVTATWNSMSGVSTINVPDPDLTSITLAPAGPTVPFGGNLQLIVTGYHSDGSAHDVTSQAIWTVDNPSIASIAPGGMATGLQVGSTQIHVLVGDVGTSDTLTVQPVLSVSYFDTSSGADSSIRVTNPNSANGDLCSMFYVFNQDQQMTECCGCRVSPNGLLTLSLANDLLGNPLTGTAPPAGSIDVISAQPGTGGICDASSLTPTGSVLAWLTQLPSSETDSMLVLDHVFSSSPLGPTELTALQAQCSFVQQLGSGQGICDCGGSSAP